MPDLKNFSSKTTQLRALQQVQDEAVSSYKDLKDRADLFKKLSTNNMALAETSKNPLITIRQWNNQQEELLKIYFHMYIPNQSKP